MKTACFTCGYPRFRPEGHAVWCEPHNKREAEYEAKRYALSSEQASRMASAARTKRPA